MPSSSIKKIHVRLLGESVDVWRPVDAIEVHDSLFRIDDQPVPIEDEPWQFHPGDLVRCESVVSDDDSILVAVERHEPKRHAWVASSDEVEEADRLGITRFRGNATPCEHILASPSAGQVAVASCALILYAGYAWLDGFTAPVGDPWRSYVTALTTEALRRSYELQIATVNVDAREIGKPARWRLRELGFEPRADERYGLDNPTWTVSIGRLPELL